MNRQLMQALVVKIQQVFLLSKEKRLLTEWKWLREAGVEPDISGL